MNVPMAIPVKQPPPTELLLQVHLAEYQALMNRNTYWITLQFALYSVAAIFVGVVLQIPDASMSRSSVRWFILLGLQIVGAIWQQTSWELLDTIKYVEKRLRPLVVGIIGDQPFWGYDPYVLFRRSAEMLGIERILAILMNCAVVLAAFVSIVVLSLYTRPFAIRDWAWLAANAVSGLTLLFQAVRLGKILRELVSVGRVFETRLNSPQ